MPETPQTLFDHASALHRLAPDQPLPREGEPFPDDQAHDEASSPKYSKHQRLGSEVAGLLAEYLADSDAQAHELAPAFHGLYVPIHPNEHIDYAAKNADRDRVLATGRWLVRNGTDRCTVTMGLSIIGAVGIDPQDIPLVQTIGLLSERFGALAARALKEVDGGAQALIWLADRVEGWGRVYIVEAICGLRDPTTFPWLLRKGVDGDFLAGYYAGKIADTGRLHEAVGKFDSDPELVDATCLLLATMCQCEGMGSTLGPYPHAGPVLSAHSRALAQMGPTPIRIQAAAVIAQYLGLKNPHAAATSAAWNAARTLYIEALGSESWAEGARAAVRRGDRVMSWIAKDVAPGLGLPWAATSAEE